MLLPNHVGDFSNKCLYPSLLLPSLCGTPVILSRYSPPIPPLLWHLQKLGMSCCHVRALANLPVCVAACMSICCLWLLFFLSWETEAGMLSFICSYAEPSSVRRTSLSSEKRDYYLLRFWEGSCELKGGGEGKRYVNQSIWGFIWAWWWWFFHRAVPCECSVLCLRPFPPTSCPCLLLTLMHAPSQRLEQVLWTSCSIPVHLADPHRGVSAQNRGFTTLQRMLWASPRREASSPEQVLFGVLHRGPLKGLLWADSGQSSRSKWWCKISVLRVPAHEAVIVGLQKEPLSPRLPPPRSHALQNHRFTAPLRAPPVCGVVRHCHTRQWEMVREMWAGPQLQPPSWRAQGMGCGAAALATVPRCRASGWFEESVASRLEEHVYEDSLETLSLDK